MDTRAAFVSGHLIWLKGERLPVRRRRHKDGAVQAFLAEMTDLDQTDCAREAWPEAKLNPRGQAELRDAACRDLAAEVSRRFGEVRLKVTGTSMLPTLWPGDILTVRRRGSAELRHGDIVLCYRDHWFVAHRLAGRRGDCLITRGDCLPYPDRPFREDEVLGKVVSVFRGGRTVDPSPSWWQLAGSPILRRSELCARILLRLRRLLWVN